MVDIKLLKVIYVKEGSDKWPESDKTLQLVQLMIVYDFSSEWGSSIQIKIVLTVISTTASAFKLSFSCVDVSSFPVKINALPWCLKQQKIH